MFRYASPATQTGRQTANGTRNRPVQRGILYCSSVFGYRNIPIHQLQPELPTTNAQLLLSTDPLLIKGSPILIQWYPSSPDGKDGVLEIVNIDLLTTLLLEPRKPLITGASLTVGNRHLIYGNGVVETLPTLKMSSVINSRRNTILYH